MLYEYILCYASKEESFVSHTDINGGLVVVAALQLSIVIFGFNSDLRNRIVVQSRSINRLVCPLLGGSVDVGIIVLDMPKDI